MRSALTVLALASLTACSAPDPDVQLAPFSDCDEMSKYMEMYYVPSYMIFDKQGNLIDFMADRPNIPKIGESKLEKTLKGLAEK